MSGINGIGYNTADNYIYGVSGTKLHRIDSAGSFTAGTTIVGSVGSVGGGDFYGGKLVVAPTSGNTWSAIDVTNATATSNRTDQCRQRLMPPAPPGPPTT